jgi:hypothetical protein
VVWAAHAWIGDRRAILSRDAVPLALSAYRCLVHQEIEIPIPEELLASEGVTQVVRISDTVRRPVRPFTATIQAYVVHLRGRGFRDAPKPLGYDADGREVLSFVDGNVPLEPLPDCGPERMGEFVGLDGMFQNPSWAAGYSEFWALSAKVHLHQFGLARDTRIGLVGCGRHGPDVFLLR